MVCTPELLPQLGALSPNRLFVSPEADWEIDFTPWPAPTLQGGRPFADGSVLGGAPAFLHWVEGELLPVLGARFALDPAQNSVLGYSLGGLFALWAVCRCSTFFQCACLSGSLWYPDWVDFLKEHTPKPPKRVYLSLGKKEEKSGPAVMRAVGDATRQSAGLLAQSLGSETPSSSGTPAGTLPPPSRAGRRRWPGWISHQTTAETERSQSPCQNCARCSAAPTIPPSKS